MFYVIFYFAKKRDYYDLASDTCMLISGMCYCNDTVVKTNQTDLKKKKVTGVHVYVSVVTCYEKQTLHPFFDERKLGGYSQPSVFIVLSAISP